ncbi:hypothetical protein Ddye_016467, partial [Dipteronia dyeriana]
GVVNAFVPLSIYYLILETLRDILKSEDDTNYGWHLKIYALDSDITRLAAVSPQYVYQNSEMPSTIRPCIVFVRCLGDSSPSLWLD